MLWGLNFGLGLLVSSLGFGTSISAKGVTGTSKMTCGKKHPCNNCHEAVSLLKLSKLDCKEFFIIESYGEIMGVLSKLELKQIEISELEL